MYPFPTIAANPIDIKVPFFTLDNSPTYIKIPAAYIRAAILCVKVPVGAAVNYGAVKLATKYGTTAAAGVLNYRSYLLMHTIGAVFTEIMKTAGDYFEQTFNRQPEKSSSFLKKFIWKVITVFDFVVNKIDRIYCFIIKQIFGEIHTFQEAAKLPNRKLCMSEIFRKVMTEHVKDQFLYIGSWEIGRRGTELLLKTTITTLMPCTKLVYTGIFFVTWYAKVHALRLKVYEEQKEEIDLYFKEPEALINEHVASFLQTLTNHQEDALRISKQVEDLKSLSQEFVELVDAFEIEWQFYNSEEIDDLNDRAAFYQSICTQYERCNTPESLEVFKNDLNEYLHPPRSLFGRVTQISTKTEQ